MDDFEICPCGSIYKGEAEDQCWSCGTPVCSENCLDEDENCEVCRED